MAQQFTTTFPSSFIQELDNAAKSTRRSKNDLLLEAFEVWNKNRIQQEIASAYSAGIDSELQEIADEGLVDTLDSLNIWEK